METEWKEIEQLFLQSSNEIRIEMPSNQEKQIIANLKISEQSVLGKLLVNVSGIVVNDYLRVFGKEGDLDILAFNDRIKQFYPGNKLIVASDIWGGIFAISNGDFEGDIRNIWYFAPDLLQWENLEINYAEFIAWICSTAIQDFYQSFIWKDIKSMLQKINANEAILIYPFLWTNECNIEMASKKIIPLDELIALNVEYQKKINN